MTEMAQGLSQSHDTQSSSPVTTQAPQTAPVSAPASEERTFKQSEVNGIVNKARHEALESYKRMQESQVSQTQQMQPANNTKQYDENTFRKMIAEENQKFYDERMADYTRQQEEAQAKNTVGQFWNKVEPGRAKYDDFNKRLESTPLANYPNIVSMLAHNVDNAPDVLYHLMDNKVKMWQIEQMALQPNMAGIAAEEMNKLSQSIKDNEAASKVKVPNAPLSQMRPSNIGTNADNTDWSVRSARQKYRI